MGVGLWQSSSRTLEIANFDGVGNFESLKGSQWGEEQTRAYHTTTWQSKISNLNAQSFIIIDVVKLTTLIYLSPIKFVQIFYDKFKFKATKVVICWSLICSKTNSSKILPHKFLTPKLAPKWVLGTLRAGVRTEWLTDWPVFSIPAHNGWLAAPGGGSPNLSRETKWGTRVNLQGSNPQLTS